MSNAYVIETRDEAAGIVVREGQRFRFLSSSPRFWSLDGKDYRSPKEAERAALGCWLCGPYAPNQYVPTLKFDPADLSPARPALPASSASQAAGDLFIGECFSGRCARL
jgi:hypothetical protein